MLKGDTEGVIEEFPYRNEAWATVLPVLRGLTGEQLAFRTEWTPHSIGWIVDHVAGVEDFWVNEIAFRAPLVAPADVDERDLAGLIAKHDRVRAATEHWLRWTRADEMGWPIQVPVFPDGWKPSVEVPTVRWAVQHALSHEAYHFGQVVMLLRAQGIEDPLF